MNNEIPPGSGRAFEELRGHQEKTHREIRELMIRLKTEGVGAEIVDETPETVTIEFAGSSGEIRRSGFMKTGDVCERIEENIKFPHDPDPNASRRAESKREEEK
jgi:hypothetical protein